MDDEIICIYFSDEPYVDATITKEELLAALKETARRDFLVFRSETNYSLN